MKSTSSSSFFFFFAFWVGALWTKGSANLINYQFPSPSSFSYKKIMKFSCYQENSLKDKSHCKRASLKIPRIRGTGLTKKKYIEQ